MDVDGVVSEHCEQYEQDAIYDDSHRSSPQDKEVEEVVGGCRAIAGGSTDLLCSSRGRGRFVATK